MECPVCLEPKRDIPLLACGHPLCEVCLPRLNRRICPLCRHQIDDDHIRNEQDTHDVLWEHVDVYTFDFNVQVPISTRLRSTRRRRRALPTHTRVGEEAATHAIPTTVSETTASEILSELTPSMRGDALEARTAVSDKKKQRYRHNRNRWREHMTQRRARWP
jgi:hypothetical protein